MARILVIEDNENNRVLLTRRLKARGHEVVTVEDAEKGLALAQTGADLILMDIGLPGLDGWAATRRLKAHPATQQIPVIALTAHAVRSGRTSQTEYDANGNATASIDGGGHTTQQEFDADGRVTAALDGIGNTTLYAFDPDGNLTSLVDPDGSRPWAFPSTVVNVPVARS